MIANRGEIARRIQATVHAFGIKTGNHSKAKKCISAVATTNGRTLIAILLGCKTKKHQIQDVKSLFDLAFSEKVRNLARSSRIFAGLENGSDKPKA